MMQMGSVLPRIIIAMAQCPEDSIIYFSKFDITDGFWRVLNELGKEYNFAFVMPTTPDEPIQIVVPSAIQMGWVDAPAYFSGASETARDVAAEYAEAPLGALPEHHLEKKTELPVALAKEMANRQPLPLTLEQRRARDLLHYILEVYMDDFIAAARARTPEELKHISRALLHAIHDVFPEGRHSADDQPVSIKKIDKGEAQWDVLKEVLGWLCDGKKKTIRLPNEKVTKITGAIKEMLRCNAGTPFEEFRKLMGKLQHASIGVPAGKGFMTPLNHQLAKSPKKVWFRKGSLHREALILWKELLQDAMTKPTRS